MFLQSLPGNIEVIVSFVGHPFHIAHLRLVAAFRRRFAADGMQTLDTLCLTKDAISGSYFRAQQQPWDCIGIRAVVSRPDISDHLASVIRLPGRPGIVSADPFPGTVE